MSFSVWLWQQLQHNQFLAAALVAAPVTALTYAARTLPYRFYTIAKKRLTLTVTFNSDVPDYLAAQEFVAEQICSDRWTRTYVYASERSYNRGLGEEETVYRGLTPGYGAHFGWWQGRPVFVERTQQESQATEKFKEQMALTFLTRSRAVVDSFAQAVRNHGERDRERDRVPLFINSGNWWRCASKLPKRPMQTVFTTAGEAETALAHVRAFEAKQQWYRERGLPWHTGILLTGKPGTGKTSLVHALASELERSLYYLNLGSIESDQELADLVASSRDWRRALLVIEDADAGGIRTQRPAAAGAAPGGAQAAEEGPREPLTLSALLNVLDGLLTPDGLVVVASSNHPERLDPALRRPGRFDLQLDLGDLDWASFVRMARLFGQDIDEDDRRQAGFQPAPGATLRAMLLESGVEGVLGQPIEAVA